MFISENEIGAMYGDGGFAGGHRRTGKADVNLVKTHGIVKIIISGPDDFAIYLDNELLSTNYSDAGNGGEVQSNSYPMTLGGVNIGNNQTEFFKGEFEYLKISTSEYTNDEENSIGYWKADNILGNNFIDHSPNQNHGIIYGATWIEIDEDLDDCLSNQYDCAGICDGNAVLDECGVCEGPGITEGTCDCEGSLPAENFDCSGNCLTDIDCAGTCGGNAVLDECGNCDSTPDNDCYQDCLGVWDGDAILDSNGDCCPNSSLIDECGICEGTGLLLGFLILMEMDGADLMQLN